MYQECGLLVLDPQRGLGVQGSRLTWRGTVGKAQHWRNVLGVMGSQWKGSQHGTEEGLGGDEVKTGEVSRGRELRIGSLRMLRHSRHVYGVCKDPKAPPEQGVLGSVVDEKRQEDVQRWSLGFIL